MSKAILVIDMPDSCSKCKFIYEFQGKKKCQLMNALNGGFSMISQNNFTVKRYEKCPLLQITETNQEAIEISLHDLKFIRDGYKNLAENGADNMRAVGKGVDCKVECKTYKELYEHYVKSLDMAIKALEKQISKKTENKMYSFYPNSSLLKSKYGKCPVCKSDQVEDEYCANCGQKLDWSEE